MLYVYALEYGGLVAMCKGAYPNGEGLIDIFLFLLNYLLVSSWNLYAAFGMTAFIVVKEIYPPSF